MGFRKKKTAKKAFNELVSVGALWEGSREGMLRGSFDRTTDAFEEAVEKFGFGGLNIFIFSNKFKDQENQPDYKLYVSEKQEAKKKKSRPVEEDEEDEDEDEEEEEDKPKKKGKKSKKGKTKLPWEDD